MVPLLFRVSSSGTGQGLPRVRQVMTANGNGNGSLFEVRLTICKGHIR